MGSGSNPTSAAGQDTVTIHDLAIQKTVGSSSFVEGSDVTFTLNYETSEYRYSQSAAITDILPNGLCPIDATTNYDQDNGGGGADLANHGDCASSNRAGPLARLFIGRRKPGPDPPAGSFTLTWDLPTPLTTDLDGTITYRAVDRTYYQQYQGTFGPAAPTLTNDSFSNTVSVASGTYATCDNTGGTIDPECSSDGSTAIYPTGEPGGYESTDAAAESNPSSAGQSAGQPSISKLIAPPVPDGSGGITCAGASYSASTTLVFQKGDVACFQLTVDFPAGLYTRDPVVGDYLPPNSTYVGPGIDGAAPGPSNTVVVPPTVPSSPVAVSNGDAGQRRTRSSDRPPTATC